ncbi:ABC transporter permease [Ruminococcaceae bacterium OttesenSCG-928-I18]|nr:ABC transporter permease [Ruminococcaceae bacterium OttesenSCG-928-I18]
MLGYFRDTFTVFRKYYYLLKNLVQRDLKVKYRRSTLGFLWSFLNPILMMLIMAAVFSYMFRFQIEYFAAYLLSAQLIFNFYNSATSTAMGSVVGNSALIKKVYIPKYIFPFEKVIFEFINALFAVVALFVVLLVTRVPFTPWILLFPIPLVLIFVFNLGVGLILSSLVVFFRDVQHLYGVVVVALNYLTPIFYPVSMLPGWMQFAIKFNPLYWYVGMFRQVVLYGAAPTANMWICCLFCSAAALLIGLLVFKAQQDKFILYI